MRCHGTAWHCEMYCMPSEDAQKQKVNVVKILEGSVHHQKHEFSEMHDTAWHCEMYCMHSEDAQKQKVNVLS